jgi:hypothetical protein
MVWNSILWRAAPTAAESRFTQCVEHIVERFIGAYRLPDDSPREAFADEVELAKPLAGGICTRRTFVVAAAHASALSKPRTPLPIARSTRSVGSGPAQPGSTQRGR